MHWRSLDCDKDIFIQKKGMNKEFFCGNSFRLLSQTNINTFHLRPLLVIPDPFKKQEINQVLENELQQGHSSKMSKTAAAAKCVISLRSTIK